jgi:predicted ATPase/class 3 adenylate cyclase
MHRVTPDRESGIPDLPRSAQGGTQVYRCFLFTDIEGSTTLWERYGEPFRAAMDLHHAIIREVLREYDGQELLEAGDGFLICFQDAVAAARCAAEAQARLSGTPWPAVAEPLLIRMGLHAGDVEPRDNGEYRGLVLNRAARVRDTAHGGQVICSAEVAHALKDEFSCRELGRFRLKGLPEPERLFQLEWEGMPRGTFPPPNAPPAFTHNLPQHPTRFIGRVKDVGNVRKLVMTAGRLVTLTGPGGTGKTRLALAVGESLLEHFSHAVFFIPLADIEDVALVPRQIADALGLEPEADKSPEDQITAFLGQEDALLIFDNFERLTLGGADILKRLIGRLPKLRCLVTSRNRIDLLGEREYPVPPLATPHGGASFEELRQVDSVELYVDRAQLARTDFELHERNAQAVAELCTRLDGIPLAIELAAARADVVTPQEILKSLGRQLDSLAAADASDTPSRHRTLRAAIEWSFEFLPPALREFFANLSIFRGGWTAAGAEAVAATPGLGEVSANILRALSELRAASLIVTEEAGDAMRFRMLETLRQFAEERFQAAADVATITTRHRLFYMAMAEEAELKLQGPEQGVWIERLEAEHDNFRAVLETTYDDDLGLRVSGSLALFWYRRGYFQEGGALVARQLERHGEAPPLIEMTAINCAGIMALHGGELESAKRHFEAALVISREIKDDRNIAGLLHNIALVASSKGDFESSERDLIEALEIYTRLGTQEKNRARLLVNLANLFLKRKESHRAKEVAEQAVEVLLRVPDPAVLGNAYQILATAETLLGNLDAARGIAMRALDIAGGDGDGFGFAHALSVFAEIDEAAGDLKSAVAAMGAAFYVAEATGRRDWELNPEITATVERLRSNMDTATFGDQWATGREKGRAYALQLRVTTKR